MIKDIALVWQTVTADLQQQDSDLLLDNSLTTAVLVSLFTDRRAQPADELPTGVRTDSRGWWGDCFNARQIGSRLWLLSREKQLPTVLTRAREYAIEALQWLVDEKLIKHLEVEATNPKQEVLQLTIMITLQNNERLPMSFKTYLQGV